MTSALTPKNISLVSASMNRVKILSVWSAVRMGLLRTSVPALTSRLKIKKTASSLSVVSNNFLLKADDNIFLQIEIQQITVLLDHTTART